MKTLAKKFVVAILGRQLRRLLEQNPVKIVAIAGSIGKTSTKFSIAAVLSAKYKVLFQEGNYNDSVSVPLIFFNQAIPSLFNPFAWLGVFARNNKIISGPYPYEVVIVELGTDGPGQIAQFAKYISADIGVLTAVAPEHMQFFKDLDAVAREETALFDFSKQMLVNIDLVDNEYLTGKKYTSYAIKKAADYQVSETNFKNGTYDFTLKRKGSAWLQAAQPVAGEALLYSSAAAAAAGDSLGVAKEQIITGLKTVETVPGRMQILNGVRNSIIIDDTYNASPAAAKAAIDTLYAFKDQQKIALLGNMNELGGYSRSSHEEVGAYCDPKQIDFVVTIGPDANEYLAAAAAKNGCAVKKFNDPYSAGEFIKGVVKDGAVILAKGSQNGVFAEEAVKALLDNPADQSKLVRQSPAWLKIKQRALG